MFSSAKSLPIGNWKEHMVRRYAEPYQPTSLIELNSDVIAGVATAMMDRSWFDLLTVALQIRCHHASLSLRTRPEQMHDSISPVANA
jgi:hypothetical protein